MIIELGRLVGEVELKKVVVGTEEKSVVNNRFAIKHDKENSSFIDVTAWGSTAEAIAKFLKKGDEVFIEGELRNKKSKVAEKEITVPYILITRVRFTYGNKNIESVE